MPETIYEAEIVGYNHAGVPLAKIDGAAVFTNDGVVGDTVRLRIVKNGRKFIFAETLEIVTPSPHRIPSDCESFSAGCGGCDFRQASYEAELRFKSDMLLHAFREFDTAEILPLVKADNISEYRNKAQYKFAKTDTVEYGFYARGSHKVVPCTNKGGCKLHPPMFGQIAETVRRMAGELKLSVYNEQTRQGVLRGLFVRQGSGTTGSGTAVVFCVKRNVPELKKIAASLRREHDVTSVITNVSPAASNVVLGEKDFALYGDGCVSEKLSWDTGHIILSAPYRSFLQVNTAQCEKLYDIVYGFADLRAGDRIADLYCGIGSIGIYLAARSAMSGIPVSVLGVDEVGDSILAAADNAARNNVSALYKRGDCSDFAKLSGLAEQGGSEKISLAILDPARKGAGEKMLTALAALAPRKVIYVSCNPDTAARDCEILRDFGYGVKKIQECDMFPRTHHCECVILLDRKTES